MLLNRFGYNANLSAACEAAGANFAPEKNSVIARDRTVVRRLAVRQIEHDFVDIAPAPSLRRIVALDDGMASGMEMCGRVLVGRIVAAADVTAGPADPQMQPHAAALQA